VFDGPKDLEIFICPHLPSLSDLSDRLLRKRYIYIFLEDAKIEIELERILPVKFHALKNEWEVIEMKILDSLHAIKIKSKVIDKIKVKVTEKLQANLDEKYKNLKKEEKLVNSSQEFLNIFMSTLFGF
jgi:hypothetical protein